MINGHPSLPAGPAAGTPSTCEALTFTDIANESMMCLGTFGKATKNLEDEQLTIGVIIGIIMGNNRGTYHITSLTSYNYGGYNG